MVEVLDDLLGLLGTGKWNILTFVAVAYWFNVIVYHALGGAFLAPAVEHTCRIPEGGQPLETSEGHINECYYIPNGFSNITEPCQEWDFDNLTFGHTITSEFGLVCAKTYLRSIYQSTYMLGSFIAAPVGGILADKYGRKFIFTIGSLCYFVLSLISCWLPNMSSILVFRFLMGMMHTPTMNAGYILGMEVCSPSMRSVVGVLVALPWAVGTILWGGFACLIREWRWLQFTVCLPTAILLPALWFMDESPRWLAVRGHHERALKIFHRAARWNGATLPLDAEIQRLMKITQSQAATNSENAPVTGISKVHIIWSKLKKCAVELFILFRTPKLRSITLTVWLDFLLTSTVFFGLSLNATNFHANPHFYMIISGFVEIPAYLVTPPVAARFGRKLPTGLGYFLTSICLLVLPFIKNDLSWLVMLIAMVGKLALSSAFQLLFLYSSELFPTEVRLQGFGSAIFVSRVGGMAAPFITDILGSALAWFPSIVFGTLSGVASGVTLILPETLKRPLPDTIGDLENPSLAKNRSPDAEGHEMGETHEK